MILSIIICNSEILKRNKYQQVSENLKSIQSVYLRHYFNRRNNIEFINNVYNTILYFTALFLRCSFCEIFIVLFLILG